MALIQCPECGKEVSSIAQSCPHCGYPIANMANKPVEPTTVIDLTDETKQEIVQVLSNQNDKLNRAKAIRVLRDATGLDFDSAKEYIENEFISVTVSRKAVSKKELAEDLKTNNDTASDSKFSSENSKQESKIILVFLIIGAMLLLSMCVPSEPDSNDGKCDICDKAIYRYGLDLDGAEYCKQHYNSALEYYAKQIND